MPVPTYDQFIEPVLRYLANHTDGALARDVHEAAAVALGLFESDRQEILPSGRQAVYKNRAGWAHDRLKRAGYSSSPRRGLWKLTDAGRAFAQAQPQPPGVVDDCGRIRQCPAASADEGSGRGVYSSRTRLRRGQSLRQHAGIATPTNG